MFGRLGGTFLYVTNSYALPASSLNRNSQNNRNNRNNRFLFRCIYDIAIGYIAASGSLWTTPGLSLVLNLRAARPHTPTTSPRGESPVVLALAAVEFQVRLALRAHAFGLTSLQP